MPLFIFYNADSKQFSPYLIRLQSIVAGWYVFGQALQEKRIVCYSRIHPNNERADKPLFLTQRLERVDPD